MSQTGFVRATAVCDRNRGPERDGIGGNRPKKGPRIANFPPFSRAKSTFFRVFSPFSLALSPPFLAFSTAR